MRWALALLVLAWQVGFGIACLRGASRQRREGEARWRWMPAVIVGWGRVATGAALAGGFLLKPWLFVVGVVLLLGQVAYLPAIVRLLGAREPRRPGKPFADAR